MKNKLLLALIGLGLAAAYVGVKYRIPWVAGLLLAGLGVYSLAAGARMLLTRRAEIPTSSGASAHVEQHTGVTAQLWGALFLMFGAITIAFGLIIWFVPEGDAGLGQRIVNSPLLSGLAMSGVGLGVGFYGATRLFARREAFRETKLNRFEQLFGGVLFSTIGLVTLTAGVVRIVAPDVLVALRDQLIAWVRDRMLR